MNSWIKGRFWPSDSGFNLWTLIFATSVYRGLNSGIRLLADTNILLAMLVLLFILVVGPTVLILTMTANSFGLLLDNFFR